MYPECSALDLRPGPEQDGQSDEYWEGIMLKASRVIAILVASAGLVLASAPPASAHGGRPFTIQLTGAAEVTTQGIPNQGDPDGNGTARLWINPGKSRVCWTIKVAHVEPIMAAHIHVGASTTTGPVVVPLSPYSAGCTTVTRQLALALVRTPNSYYVNVHNATYPAGALRGQLDR